MCIRDSFDIDQWTDYSRSQKYAPLIRWNKFLNNHPKDLILVYHTWNTNECGEYMTQATKEFVTKNSLNIIRRVCVNFRNTGVLSLQKFVDTIYGKLKPSKVVVIFNHWGDS